MSDAYIVQAVRTAGGRRNGKLAGWHPADMAGEVLNALVERSGLDPKAVEDVILGCVSQVGEQAFHIGRNAVLASKLPDSIPAVTIDRQCGSSQQAIHFAAQAVMSGTQDVVIAAGVESMSRVPIGTPVGLAAKAGLGAGPWSERIQSRYGVKEFSQFTGAQMVADKYKLNREKLDAYALSSHQRAAAATKAGAFATELVALQVEGGVHTVDEGIRFDATSASIGGVKLLQEGGVLSAANSSQICDGASGVLVVSEQALKTHRLKPLARIHNMTVTGGDPVIMLEEPIPATRKALQRGGLRLEDIDLYEVNEAFASIPLAWLQALGADPARLNVNGGAIALGHPLGATGAKLMATLVHALRARGKRYGLQTMCEGGGLANVTIIEHSDVSDSPLLVTIEQNTAVLTLNRPDKGNSLTPQLLLALEAAWRHIENDSNIRVAIITGAGERHFCTGAAVDDLEMGKGGLQNQPYAVANRFSPRMCHVSKPVICVVNGLTNGGGLHFIADCDIVVACERADLMDSHVSVGQVSALESAGLVRRAGVGAALLLALCGRGYRMPAKRAFDLGIFDLLEPTAADALARARDLAAAISANSPQALALSKRAIWAATEFTDPAAAVHGWELLKSHWGHPDFEEGPKAFAEKRTPHWNPDPNARR